MKKLLSNRPGRSISLLVLVVFVFCFLAPGVAQAEFKEPRLGGGGGGVGDGEGDPLDTNDFGGGGGDGSDIHDDADLNPDDPNPEIRFMGIRIIMVPEFSHGKIVFRILVISARSLDLREVGLEGYHAP